jgi:sterol desaturase/sphingolipid hydroxylase (fatty acid hydroxylase superfamily)
MGSAYKIMQERFLRTLFLFLILTVVFGILEKLFPSIRNQPKLRKGVWLDTFYWFFTPMAIQILDIAAMAALFLPIYVLLGRSLAIEDILKGYGPLAQLPLWEQGLVAIVVGDFVGYWVHRLNHSRQLWDYHAIHHSSEIMDWLTAVRLHPVNDMIAKVGQASPVLLLGLSPVSVEIYVVWLSAYVAFIHANISWTYGPFRYWLASPAFHRWHHTREKEGHGKNFASLFPIFDVIFGTFYMPKGQQPRNFGLEGDSIPLTFKAQMLYPFRNWRTVQKWLGSSDSITMQRRS